jgi:hypothetical protein
MVREISEKYWAPLWGLGRPGGGEGGPEKSAEEVRDAGGGAGGYGDADKNAPARMAAPLGAGAGQTTLARFF